jgi:hypothetical protein
MKILSPEVGIHHRSPKHKFRFVENGSNDFHTILKKYTNIIPPLAGPPKWSLSF